MNEKKIIQFMATFMAMLVITLPMYTSNVFAARIDVTVEGQDGIRNTARPNDVLDIQATVALPEEFNLDQGQLRVFREEIQNPIPCTKIEGTTDYDCNFNLNIFNSRTHDLDFYLFSDDFPYGSPDDADFINALDEETVTVVVDVKGADVTLLTSATKVSNDGKVTLTYNIEDHAESSSDTVCSGIERVEFYDGDVGGSVIKEEFGSQGECELSGTFSHTFSGDGEKRICAKAYDYVGKSGSTKCLDFSVDSSGPVFHSLNITDEDGEVRHIKKSGVFVDIKALVDDPGDLESVRGDFSRVSPGVKNKEPTSGPMIVSQNSGVTTKKYIWRNIKVQNVDNCNLDFIATDKLGNKETTTLSCNLAIDDVGPKITDFRTDQQDEEGNWILGKKGQVIVEFQENGIGMAGGDVFLNLNKIGFGTSRKMDSCEEVGSKWRCVLNVTPTKEGTREINVLKSTHDKLGNKVQEGANLNVKVDVSEPTNVEVTEIRILAGETELPLATKGDTIQITVKGDDFVVGTADFTEIGGDKGVPCTPVNQTHCIFEEEIKTSGPANATLELTLFDEFLNGDTVEAPLQVFGVITEENPDYWTTPDIACTPEIDINTASLIQRRAYCIVDLQPQTGVEGQLSTASIVGGDLSQCEGANTEFIANMDLIQTNPGSTQPVFALTLSASEFEDDITLTCPLHIISQVGNDFTQNAETENVTMQVQFFESPEGNLNKALEDKIQGAVDDAEGALSWVETLQQIFDFLEKICQIKNLVSKVLAAIDTVIAVMGATAAALKIGVITYAAGEAVDASTILLCQSENGLQQAVEGSGFWEILDSACAFLECGGADDSNLKSNDILRYASGGAPWCAAIQDFLNEAIPVGELVGETGVQAESSARPEKASLSKPFNIKESIVLSTACLCLPGVIYNLNKYRQIKCGYAACLAGDVKSSGVPVSYCDNLHGYLQCSWIIGEVFSLIPFNALLSQMANLIIDLLAANPFTIVRVLSGLFCKATCAPSGTSVGLTYSICIVPITLNKIGDAIATAQSIKPKDYFETGTSECERLEEVQGDF